MARGWGGGVWEGEGEGGLQTYAFISPPSVPSHNDSSIHSSAALPDFNFAINQQNKQTSGRKGGKERGAGWRVGGLQRMRFSLWLSLYRQKEPR